MDKYELTEQEQIWYDQIYQYINDTAKYDLFKKAFIEILNKLVNSLIEKIK